MWYSFPLDYLSQNGPINLSVFNLLLIRQPFHKRRIFDLHWYELNEFMLQMIYRWGDVLKACGNEIELIYNQLWSQSSLLLK